jgi:hypothetical protein
MAKPLQPGKQPVALPAEGARVSKIRRDPPPVARKTVVPDRDETDRKAVAIGILAFTLAVIVIVIGVGSWTGWSPSEYTVHLRLR